MEFAASKLARGADMPIMVIESSTQLSYFNPCDTTKLIAAHGDFTVRDDVSKVNGTLSKMASAKADYYKDEGDMSLYRAMLIYTPRFAPGTEEATPSVQGEAQGEAAVAALKQRVGWRGDAAEAGWMKESGWNLVMLAVALNDLAALQHLLTADGGAPPKMLKQRLKQRLKLMKLNSDLRKQPFSILLSGSLENFDAMCLAATFASPPVIRSLIDAGAPVDVKAPCGVMGCWNEGGCRSAKVENVAAILEARPELASKKDMKGSYGLTYALLAPKHVQADLVRLFLSKMSGDKATLKEQLNKRDLFGFNASQFLAMNPDIDPKVFELLAEAGADLEAPVKFGLPIRMMFSFMSFLARFGSLEANALKRDPFSHMGKKTVPLVMAERGNTQMVKKYLEVAQINPDAIRDKKGVSPVDKLVKTHGDTAAPSMLAKVLGVQGGNTQLFSV